MTAETSWLGKPTKTGRVIYLSAEDDDEELHRRVDGILAAERKTYDDLDGLTLRSLAGENALLAVESELSLLESELFKELERRAGDEGPAPVVMDSLSGSIRVGDSLFEDSNFAYLDHAFTWRLGYISSNTFFKIGSGKPLREYLLKEATIESVVDFGDGIEKRLWPDAEAIRTESWRAAPAADRGVGRSLKGAQTGNRPPLMRRFFLPCLTI